MPEPVETNGQGAPPAAGEQVHLPGPSYLPIALAFGLALAVCGIVITWVLCVIGGAIALIALVRWIRETREEISQLPLQR